MTDGPAPDRGKAEILTEVEIRSLVVSIVRNSGVDKDITLDEEAAASALIAAHKQVTALQVVRYCREQGLVENDPDYDAMHIHRWKTYQQGEDTNADDEIDWLNADCPGRTSVLSEGELVRAVTGEYEVPERMDGYKVEGVLGSGAMGFVYLAVHPVTERHVAIKTIHPKLVDEKSFERFKREGKVLMIVTHPHIVRVYELVLDSDTPYIVMEYVEGQNLDEALPAMRGDDVAGRARIIREICDGVQSLHEFGIVHRDLKPKNIRIDKRGRVRVVDLGLARDASDTDIARNREELANLGESAEVTAHGVILGTAHFMSPEQIDGRSVVGPPADVYAIGKLIYFLYTGLHIHSSYRTAHGVMQAVIKENGIPQNALELFEQEIPEQDREYLVPIVRKCLQPQARDRYQNAGEVVEDLDKYLGFVRNRDRALQRKREARYRKLMAGLVSLAAVSLVSVAMALLFLRQRNVEALAAREAHARAEAEQAAKMQAEARVRAELDARNEAQARADAEEKKNLFSTIQLRAIGHMKNNRWPEAKISLYLMLEIDSGSISSHQDLAQVLCNLRSSEAVREFIWLAEHGQALERNENLLMAMIAFANYGQKSPRETLPELERIAAMLKTAPYADMARLLILDTQMKIASESADPNAVQGARQAIKEIILARVDDVYESAAANYVLGVYIAWFFPPRAIHPLNEACAINREFNEALMAQQNVRRSIAWTLPASDTAKSVHLVAALDILISLKARQPNDPLVDMAYADCLLECSMLPILKDFKYTYLKRAGEVVDGYESDRRSADQNFLASSYLPNGILIELTTVKTHALRYCEYKKRNLQNAGMYKMLGKDAIVRLQNLTSGANRQLSPEQQTELNRVTPWLR